MCIVRGERWKLGEEYKDLSVFFFFLKAKSVSVGDHSCCVSWGRPNEKTQMWVLFICICGSTQCWCWNETFQRVHFKWKAGFSTQWNTLLFKSTHSLWVFHVFFCYNHLICSGVNKQQPTWLWSESSAEVHGAQNIFWHLLYLFFIRIVLVWLARVLFAFTPKQWK